MSERKPTVTVQKIGEDISAEEVAAVFERAIANGAEFGTSDNLKASRRSRRSPKSQGRGMERRG